MDEPSGANIGTVVLQGPDGTALVQLFSYLTPHTYITVWHHAKGPTTLAATTATTVPQHCTVPCDLVVVDARTDEVDVPVAILWRQYNTTSLAQGGPTHSQGQ
jgi:hypothetical protein